jgi:hypothetical protein
MGKLGKFKVYTSGPQAFLGAAGFEDSVGRLWIESGCEFDQEFTQ